MVVMGKFRNRAELRKKPRRHFEYTARVFIDKQTPPIKCSIADVSASGARIVLQTEQDLPEHFILLLTQSGNAQRNCRVVWRNGLIVGVEFVYGAAKDEIPSPHDPPRA